MVGNCRFLVKAGLIVFLNKQDVLERKIKEGRNIARYFPEYNNFKFDDASDEYTKAKEFVKHMLVVNIFEIYKPIKPERE